MNHCPYNQILKEAQLPGFGGNCGMTAVVINNVLFDGQGTYVGAFNNHLLDQGRPVGHVAVRFNGKYYDARGELPEEDLLTFAMLDPWIQTSLQKKKLTVAKVNC